MGRILANLDCELHWAKRLTPGPHKELPLAVRQALARSGQLLSVFSRGSDEVSTLVEAPHAWTPGEELLAWGQMMGMPESERSLETSASLGRWQEALWHLRAKGESAAKCNDRFFAAKLVRDPEFSLPELRAIGSLEDFDHYLKTSTLGPGDSWVAKAPFSASGRERVRRRGRILDGEERVRVGRLISRYRQLLVEPWMPRVADYGCTGLAYEARSELRIFAPHQLHSDGTGVFRGVRIADRETMAALGASFARAVQGSAESAGHALHAAGYRGPFGIDAFTYHDAAGNLRLQARSEINARLSFGLVARALAEQRAQSEFDFRL